MERSTEIYGQTKATNKRSLASAPTWWLSGVNERRRANGLTELAAVGVADDAAGQSVEQKVATARHRAAAAMRAAGYTRGKRPAIRNEFGCWRKK
jgi:hypothetical protein